MACRAQAAQQTAPATAFTCQSPHSYVPPVLLKSRLACYMMLQRRCCGTDSWRMG